MSTNFLPLPSSGFTILMPKQQTAPSQGFLPCFYNKPDFGINQEVFLLSYSKYATAFALHYVEILYKRLPDKTRQIPQNPAYSPLFPNLFSGLITLNKSRRYCNSL